LQETAKMVETGSSASGECVGCGAPHVSSAVCEACGEIFEIPQDPFALFGLVRSWSVDSSALEERYSALSRVFREKSAPRADLRERVAQAVTALDAARRRLSDPVERAQYLLVSYGGVEREKPLRKREFQSEVMEFEHTATKARQEGDSARLAGVVLEAEEKLASAIMAAGQSFTRLERSLVEEVSGAADAVAEARFWRRKVDELRGVLGR
jgi:DnaJ-domain-containing protein 1